MVIIINYKSLVIKNYSLISTNSTINPQSSNLNIKDQHEI